MPGSSSSIRASDTVAPITVKFAGTALDPAIAQKLREVVIKKVRVKPDMAIVRISDPAQTLVDQGIGKIGDPLEILTGGPEDSSPVSVFKGIISALEPEFAGDGPIAGFRAYDKSQAMTKGQHTRTFQDQTAGDMIKTVAGPYCSVTVDTDTSPYTYMMQSNESDWDFIWRLARRHGLEFVLDGDSGKLRAVGADDGDAPWLQYGQSEKGHRLVSFRPRITNANLPETVSARYVDHMDKAIAVSVNMSDGKVYAGGSLVSIGGNGNFGELNGKGDFAMPNIVAKDEAQLRDAVESARDTLAATGFEAEGVAEGNPDLKPGKKVEIRGVGSYCGTFLLSEVTHMYRGSAGFQTKFVISSRPRLLLDAVNPPPTSASVASVSSPGNSLVRGEVTNLSDPDKVGRIRVKLPSIGQSDDPEGWWARIAGVSSGKERGLLMMPQVGDSVVVGFENGDTRSPFVLGSIWDGKALPGKDLVQDDGSFSLKSDSKILMKSTGDMVFETDGKVNQKASGDISIDGSSKIVIKGGQEIQIKAPQIKIQADSKIELKAPMISVAADAQLELKGSAMVSVSGGMIKLG